MVPMPESAYFPPLEKCLDREQLLISWRTVYVALSDADESGKVHIALEGFLSEPYVLQLLGRPYNPYSFTTAPTKSAFETKTAAINVTPTTKKDYKIAEIKEDALWLSKEAEIDELSALRVVVQEYQTRSSAQLRNDFSDEEIVSLQEASGSANTEITSALPRAKPSGASPGKDEVDIDSQENRRIRALQIFLSERRYLIRCAGVLLQAAWDQQDDVESSTDENIVEKGENNGETWTVRVGEKLLRSFQQAGRSFYDYLLDSIRSLRANFSNLEKGSGWFKKEGGREYLEIDWLSSRIIEAIHTMEIVLRILDNERRLSSTEPVLEWFRFVSIYGFFDQFEAPFPSIQLLIPQLQSLVAIISLALLDPQGSIEQFYDPQNFPLLTQDEKGYSAYISDVQTINDIHKIMVDAASGLSTLASPAVLAWSIILKTMRDTSMARKEARELRQSVRAEEAFEDDAYLDEENPPGIRGGRRRYSTGSEASAEAGIYEEFLETIKDTTPEDDPIRYLGASAIEGSKVFDVLVSLALFFAPAKYSDALRTKVRLLILALTRCSIQVLEYTPEIVTTALAALSGEQGFWDLLELQQISAAEDPVAIFLGDDYFVQRLLDTAMSRFPYERLPFLKIMRAIAACQTVHDDRYPVAARILEKLPSFTFQLPQDFRGYETIQEEDNANTIQLTQDVSLFQPRNLLKLRNAENGPDKVQPVSSSIYFDFSIPKGTPGRIISDSDSGPKVAIWFQEYSGLKYIGKLLEMYLIASDFVDATTGEVVDRDSVAEMIGLLATLLLTSDKIEKLHDGNMESHASAYRMLEEASDGLDRNRDIVTVIFKLFEEELQRQATGSEDDSSLDVLVASIQFIFALVPVLPGRVWPLLGRSDLLDMDGRGGKLSAIIGRVEIVSCRYDFLISSAHLLQALVEDSVSHAILRKVGSQSLVRQGSKEDLGTGVPDQILSKVLLSFTRTLVDVFESSCNWRFAIQEQRLQLSELISTILHSILGYTYGIDDTSVTDAKLTNSLMHSATYITDSYLSLKFSSPRFRPFLRSFLDGFSTPELPIQPGLVTRGPKEVRNVLIFTTALMKLAALLGKHKSHLEQQLFKISPLLARLYAVHESYRIPVVKLLEALVLSASSGEGEPPSLLGHLGPNTSRNFIQELLDFGKPLDDDEHLITIWHSMSVIVSCRQQWFSIYLLTGRPPREALKEESCGKQSANTRTLLKIAFAAISDIHELPLSRALPILEFISLAQNFWPWAMSDLHLKHSNFTKSISSFVSELKPVLASASEERSIEACYQNRLAAYIAEILAMYLYHSRQVGDTKPAIDLLPQIGFYTKCAVSVPLYNSSLHSNLKRNFEAKFNGLSLQNFKRTRLEIREFGRDYFYDIQFADKMLNSDQAWTGRKNDGLGEELAKANVNLSLVDAQVSLLYGWKLLAVELSANLVANPDLQTTVAGIVRDCLISNNRSRLPENIFARLTQTRADFSLILLQRLVEIKSTKSEVLGLLPTVWETIRSLDSSFEAVLASGDGEYYRTLLKMLFLTLRAQAGKLPAPLEASIGPNGLPNAPSPVAAQKIQSSSAIVQIILDVLNQVVARGFRDLVAAIHERSTESVAEDIGLLTAILQTCLCIPGIEFSHHNILESMSAFDVARVATTLFSWSDKLAIDGDPIYGELSILFLLELSSIPVMAEQLAIEGTLGHISTASITSYIRRGNVSSLSEGLGPQRCYSIWVRGTLPLLLNILYSVGASIAAEVAIFLNQFPKLVAQSIEAIEVPHSTLGRTLQAPRITYGMVSEVHSLALLIHVLSTFRTSLAGITEVPEVKWDTASVLENVEHWLTERTVLRERILPLGLREMEMAKQKPITTSMGCDNRLEEKVVQELQGVRDVLRGGET